jgi:hypothetical protein
MKWRLKIKPAMINSCLSSLTQQRISNIYLISEDQDVLLTLMTIKVIIKTWITKAKREMITVTVKNQQLKILLIIKLHSKKNIIKIKNTNPNFQSPSIRAFKITRNLPLLLRIKILQHLIITITITLTFRMQA